MKICEFKELYYMDFHLSNFVAINNIVENGHLFPCDTRTTSCLVHLKDCSIKYVLEDGSEVFVPKGSIVYIPHTVKYHVNYRSCSKPQAISQLVAFEMRDDNNEQIIASDKITVICSEINNIFSDTFDAIVNSCTYPLSFINFKGLLYSLIAQLARLHIKADSYSKEYFIIAPSIDYMKKNPDENIAIPKLAEISHISESCFRRLFKKQFGISPSEYLANRKIKKAQKLLQNNIYSIYEISQMLDYSDSSYFSKVFKKQTGLSPRQYRSQFQI